MHTHFFAEARLCSKTEAPNNGADLAKKTLEKNTAAPKQYNSSLVNQLADKIAAIFQRNPNVKSLVDKMYGRTPTYPNLPTGPMSSLDVKANPAENQVKALLDQVPRVGPAGIPALVGQVRALIPQLGPKWQQAVTAYITSIENWHRQYGMQQQVAMGGGIGGFGGFAGNHMRGLIPGYGHSYGTHTPPQPTQLGTSFNGVPGPVGNPWFNAPYQNAMAQLRPPAPGYGAATPRPGLPPPQPYPHPGIGRPGGRPFGMA